MKAAARWWALESALGAGLVAGLLALVAWWGVSDKAQSDKVTHYVMLFYEVGSAKGLAELDSLLRKPVVS